MRSIRLFAGAALVVLAGAAHAQVYVCLEHGEKVFRSEPCPNPKDELGAYKAPPVHVIHPREAYSGTAPAQPRVPIAQAPLPAAAPAAENCDAYVKSPPGTWDRHMEENHRQRCLDRKAGVASAPFHATCTTFGNVTNCSGR